MLTHILGVFRRCGALALVFLVACGGPSPTVETPDPRGVSATLTLTSESGDASADGPRIIERLRAVGIEAELLEAHDRTVTLGVTDAAEREGLDDGLFVRGQFDVRGLLADQSVLGPQDGDAFPELQVRALGRERVPTYEASSLEALAPIAERAGNAVVRGECSQEDDGSGEEAGVVSRCHLLALEAESITSSADVAGAEVRHDPMSGMPMVWVTFTEEAAPRFAAATAARVRSRIAVCVDENVLLSPVVMEPITAGEFAIAMPFGDRAHERAERLAAVLAGGPLSADWHAAR